MGNLHAGRGRRGSRTWAAALLAAALCAGSIATAASAHHGEPATGESEPGEFGEERGLTDATGVSTDNEGNLGAGGLFVGGPVAKPGEQAGWQQLGGSLWNEEQTITTLVEDSPTPYDLDFYGLGFPKAEVAESAGLSHAAAQAAAKSNGFAVGAQCRRSDSAQPVAPEQVSGCERIPVIYRYYEHPTRGLIWAESYRGSDATDPGGFAAAVAWLSPGRALAVGGSGTYPRRDARRETGESDAEYATRDERCRDVGKGPEPGRCEGAGMARAWLYENDSWRELENKPDPPGGFTGEGGDEIPDEMRALQSIDASPRPSDCGANVTSECAIAGGMRQLWHFADGRFTQGYGPDLEHSGAINNPGAFNSRVRDIRVFPNWRVRIRLSDPPEQLALSAPTAIRAVASAGFYLDASGWYRGGPSGVYSLSVVRRRSGPDGQCSEDDPSPQCDWFYASALSSPSGPASEGEPASSFGGPGRIRGGSSFSPEPYSPPTGRSSTRLVSADGDVRGYCDAGATTSTARLCTPGSGFDTWANSTDGIPDWAVGVLRSNGQGIAFNTAVRANHVRLCGGSACPPVITKPSQCTGDDELVPSSGIGTAPITPALGDQALCSPEAYQEKNASKALYYVGSYALNAYRVAGEAVVTGDEGTGWAVGDHGAILTRGGGVASAEAEPARVGAKREAASAAGPGVYAQHRPPVTDEPGTVPALAGRRELLSTEPDFQGPYGHALSGGEVVMSRDGSEGWSLDGFGSGFLRYDGIQWAPCDASGVPGLLPPDRACSELEDVGRINAVARVPLERDSDPSNDDEFEAVALTDKGLYGYRDGRWAAEEATYENWTGSLEPVRGDDIAFTAADDGWVVRGGGGEEVGVLHFNGERWVECAGSRFVIPDESCDDPDRRLSIRGPCPHHNPVVRLAVADERVYLIATRDVASRAAASGVCNVSNPKWQGEPYPVILLHDAGQPCDSEDGETAGCWRGGVDPDWQDGEDATPEDGYNPADGGWDPGCVGTRRDVSGTLVVEVCDGTGDRADQGQIGSISVARDADGSYQGWAIGTFGGRKGVSADATLMRLSDGGDVPGDDDEGAVKWRQWLVRDAANDYLRSVPRVPGAIPHETPQLTFPSEVARRSAFMFTGQAIAFDQERGRWAAIPTPWAASAPSRELMFTTGEVDAIAPDGQGGLWAFGPGAYHYTDRAPEPVFEDAADPATGARITALGSGADGTLWLGDENGSVYRHDRLAGWSRKVRIPEWDPPRTTRPAAVNAIAVGPSGEGVAVGDGGRIANLGEEVGLDAAAITGCAASEPAPPCGTGNDLLAAAVAPDGSAIVAGENRTVRWRPAGGDFRLVPGPPVPLATEIRKVSMPNPNRAYLLTDESRVIRGEMSAPGAWSWRIEVGDSDGKPDPLTATTVNIGGEFNLPIEDIAVDADGHGYAVGQRGLVLERTGDAEQPWRRVASGYTDDLQRVALPAGGGDGALIAGGGGLILTLTEQGRFEAARHAHAFDPVLASGMALSLVPAIGLALTPGYRPGEAEAWALFEGFRFGERTQALLHHPSPAPDPRLDPAHSLVALHDAPPGVDGEISFAAFGKQDCDAINRRSQRGRGAFAARDSCGPPDGSNTTADLVNRRITEELTESSEGKQKGQFAIFTGDAVDGPGGTPNGDGATERGGPFPVTRSYTQTPLDSDFKHRRWIELNPRRLADAGMPVLGALGGQDLAREAAYCSGPPGEPFRDVIFGGCVNPRQAGAEQLGAEQGLNLPWRAAVAFSPAPWGGTQETGGLRLAPVDGGALTIAGPDGSTPQTGPPAPADLDPNLNVLEGFLGGPRARTEPYPLGSGDTHYATDVIDESSGKKIARVVVVDTSMRSIAASDPQQHPHEAGGQLPWLEEMLCVKRLEADPVCTRDPGQQAIVVSNTPTYSYGPISPEELQTDAAVFESVLIQNEVNVVVSGRLGWQGRYWTLAPGVHAPCPGQPYRADSEAPSVTSPEICGAGAGEALDPSQATEELPDAAEDAAGLTTPSAIPFVVSSSAGGRFNVRAERGGFATAENGFWRGYSLVRLHPSGDPRKTIVEQRPILDWVGLSAKDVEVEPRKTLKLQSFAREAFGMDTAPRYYAIPDTQVITHRYHLLLADRDEPWRACEAGDSECVAYYSKLTQGPRSFDSAAASGSGSAQDDSGGASAVASSEGAGENPCEPYLCLPERVGTIDPNTGEVRAGNGRYPDTFAIATLSVGEHVAAQPLVLTRSPSFIVNPAVARPSVPGVGTDAGFSPDTPPPPNVPKPNVPQPSVPQPPALPGIPPLTAAQPPEPQPPAPPAPPPPAEQPSPLDLTVSPTALTVATPAAVIQPPTPPVNPAPPSGARREARQRQAATQKSGADSSEGSEETQGMGGDLAQSPPRNANAATRHAGGSRHDYAFTALSRADSGSAGPALLYGGGITLLALAAALGFTHGRPTPRRRTPEAPAPAFSRIRSR